MKLKFGCLIDWFGKGLTKCLKDRIGASKNYGKLHSSKRKFGSEEFPYQIGSADVR